MPTLRLACFRSGILGNVQGRGSRLRAAKAQSTPMNAATPITEPPLTRARPWVRSRAAVAVVSTACFALVLLGSRVAARARDRTVRARLGALGAGGASHFSGRSRRCRKPHGICWNRCWVGGSPIRPERARTSAPASWQQAAMSRPSPATAPGQYDHVCTAHCETSCATPPSWLRQEPATTVTDSSAPSNRLIQSFNA